MYCLYGYENEKLWPPLSTVFRFGSDGNVHLFEWVNKTERRDLLSWAGFRYCSFHLVAWALSQPAMENVHTVNSHSFCMHDSLFVSIWIPFVCMPHDIWDMCMGFLKVSRQIINWHITVLNIARKLLMCQSLSRRFSLPFFRLVFGSESRMILLNIYINWCVVHRLCQFSFCRVHCHKPPDRASRNEDFHQHNRTIATLTFINTRTRHRNQSICCVNSIGSVVDFVVCANFEILNCKICEFLSLSCTLLHSHSLFSSVSVCVCVSKKLPKSEEFRPQSPKVRCRNCTRLWQYLLPIDSVCAFFVFFSQRKIYSNNITPLTFYDVRLMIAENFTFIYDRCFRRNVRWHEEHMQTNGPKKNLFHFYK